MTQITEHILKRWGTASQRSNHVSGVRHPSQGRRHECHKVRQRRAGFNPRLCIIEL